MEGSLTSIPTMMAASMFLSLIACCTGEIHIENCGTELGEVTGEEFVLTLVFGCAPRYSSDGTSASPTSGTVSPRAVIVSLVGWWLSEEVGDWTNLLGSAQSPSPASLVSAIVSFVLRPYSRE
jgi:hypothetical protein